MQTNRILQFHISLWAGTQDFCQQCFLFWLKRIPMRKAEHLDHLWLFVKLREKSKFWGRSLPPLQCNWGGRVEYRTHCSAPGSSACIALDFAVYRQAVRLLIHSVCIDLPKNCMLQWRCLCIWKNLVCFKTYAVFPHSFISNLIWGAGRD